MQSNLTIERQDLAQGAYKFYDEIYKFISALFSLFCQMPAIIMIGAAVCFG